MKKILILLVVLSYSVSAHALRYDPRQMTNTGEYVPRSCEVWNDGCNDCEKTESGYQCPPKNCASMRMGYCRVPAAVPVSPPADFYNTGEPTPRPDPLRFSDSCVQWFDGCNTCRVHESGSTSCTKMACDSYDEPRCLEELPPQKPRQESLIPSNCVSWYDGCNTCGVENGQLTFCTEMACDQNNLQPAECRAYAENSLNEPDKATQEMSYEEKPEASFWGFIKYHLFSWMY